MIQEHEDAANAGQEIPGPVGDDPDDPNGVTMASVVRMTDATMAVGLPLTINSVE